MEELSEFCSGGSRLCGERFARDKERIERLEEKGDAVASMLAGAVGALERVTKRLDDTDAELLDHEHRLREAEKRPAGWFDRIVGAVLTAIVAAVVAWLIGGTV